MGPRIVPPDHPIHVHCFSDSLAYAEEFAQQPSNVAKSLATRGRHFVSMICPTGRSWWLIGRSCASASLGPSPFVIETKADQLSAWNLWRMVSCLFVLGLKSFWLPQQRENISTVPISLKEQLRINMNKTSWRLPALSTFQQAKVEKGKAKTAKMAKTAKGRRRRARTGGSVAAMHKKGIQLTTIAKEVDITPLSADSVWSLCCRKLPGALSRTGARSAFGTTSHWASVCLESKSDSCGCFFCMEPRKSTAGILWWFRMAANLTPIAIVHRPGNRWALHVPRALPRPDGSSRPCSSCGGSLESQVPASEKGMRQKWGIFIWGYDRCVYNRVKTCQDSTWLNGFCLVSFTLFKGSHVLWGTRVSRFLTTKERIAEWKRVTWLRDTHCIGTLPTNGAI